MGLLLSSTLLLVLMACPGRAQAQAAPDAMLEQVRDAFTRGDARALLHRAADRIEISLFGASTLYSRGQARYVMEDFFKEYPVQRCVLQQPSRADGSWFVAGSYWHDPDEDALRIYVHLRQKGEVWELREIRVSRPARN